MSSFFSFSLVLRTIVLLLQACSPEEITSWALFAGTKSFVGPVRADFWEEFPPSFPREKGQNTSSWRHACNNNNNDECTMMLVTMTKADQTSSNSAPSTPYSSISCNPAAPSGGDSVDHSSALTGSTIEDENYIALLQYRDAHHILNLPASSPLSPDAVQKAYDTSKKQALVALEQFEAKQRQKTSNANNQSRRNNVFFASQLNYLELKLQALDQAYEELMPPMDVEESVLAGEGLASSCMGEGDAYDDDDKHSAGKALTRDTTENEPFERSPWNGEEPTHPPGGFRREFVWSGDDGNGGGVSDVAKVQQCPQDQRQQQQQQQQQQHKRQPSDDESVTIDIYFRPNSKSREEPPSTGKSRTMSPVCDSHPSDVSSCTWDGSSIFSMVSGPKNGAINTSTNFLGLKVPVAGDDRGDKEGGVDFPPSSGRPPLGIDIRRASKKGPSQASPTAVSDFPVSTRDDSHYDHHPSVKSRKAELGRGRITGSSLHHARAAASPHDSVEAARMGILRALSEDNSECLPLEDDEYGRYRNDHLNTSNATSALSDEARFNAKYSNDSRDEYRKGTGITQQQLSSKCFFQGKSDKMPKDSNSLMLSVFEGRGGYHNHTPGPPSWTGDATSGSSSRERKSSPRSLASSTSTRKQPQTNSNRSASAPSMNANINSYSDAKLLRSDDQFDDMLQVGMELADELCRAFNSCWKGVDLVSGATPAMPANDSQHRHQRIDRSSQQYEEESTLCTRSTYNEDPSYVTRSVYTTDGDSTEFNTESSFSRQSNSPNMVQNKRSMTAINTQGPTPFRSKLDPPMRRTV